VVRFASDQATVPMSEEAAEFLYDPATKSVVAENDTARWLSNAPELAEPDAEQVIVIDEDHSQVVPPARFVAAAPPSASTATSTSAVDSPTSEINLADETDDPVPATVGAGKVAQPVESEHGTVESAGSRPLSRRAARRRAARKRAERREPTWDEILFGVSRSEKDD
jgi:hypothetical protein